jgi:endonuclease YncB( thermonuclease family)
MLTANRASLDPPSGQSVQAQRASDGAGQGGAQVVQHASPGSIIAGLPEVVNNATLRINGSIIRLIGVEPAPEAEREQMARYLGDRTVTCWPVSSGVRYRCEVDGNDLSRVVLYNGGGRATSDATPELLAEEKHARSARVGIWRE